LFEVPVESIRRHEPLGSSRAVVHHWTSRSLTQTFERHRADGTVASLSCSILAGTHSHL
jgi:hypothetical protein